MSERAEIERQVRQVSDSVGIQVGDFLSDLVIGRLVDLILEQRALQCDALAEEYESAAQIAEEISARKSAAECHIHAERIAWRAKELRAMKGVRK